MNTMPKWLLWLLLILNIILIWFLLSMNSLAAMWMMAVIMLLDSIGSLVIVYRR